MMRITPVVLLGCLVAALAFTSDNTAQAGRGRCGGRSYRSGSCGNGYANRGGWGGGCGSYASNGCNGGYAANVCNPCTTANAAPGQNIQPMAQPYNAAYGPTGNGQYYQPQPGTAQPNGLPMNPASTPPNSLPVDNSIPSDSTVPVAPQSNPQQPTPGTAGL